MKALIIKKWERFKIIVQSSLFISFLLQIKDIGSSAGSIFNEAIGIFRNLQKISAPVSFSYIFSGSTFGEWIFDTIHTIQLDYFELCILYSIVCPTSILMFISSVLAGKHLLCYLVVYLNFFIFGLSWSFFGENMEASIAFIVISFVFFIIGFILRKKYIFFYGYRLFSKKEQEDDDMASTDNLSNAYESLFTISRGFYPAILVFYLLMMPMLCKRQKLLVAFSVMIIIASIVPIILDYLINTKFKTSKTNVIRGIINLLMASYSLLIVPATENYVFFIQQSYAFPVQFGVGFVVLILIFPIIIINFMIKTDHPDIFNKYEQDPKTKKCCKYASIEVWDKIKDFIYAILAAFDISEACIIVELVWFIIIACKSPYLGYSDYCSTYGNVIVLLLSNIAILYAKIAQTDGYGFVWTAIFVFAAFIPAIVAIYVFFLKDFKYTVDSPEKIREEEIILQNSIEVLVHVTRILTPIAWFMFGIIIEPITRAEKII